PIGSPPCGVPTGSWCSRMGGFSKAAPTRNCWSAASFTRTCTRSSSVRANPNPASPDIMSNQDHRTTGPQDHKTTGPLDSSRGQWSGGPVVPGLFALCGWVLRYALRRWPGLAVVVLTLLLKVGLDVLRPWPMLFLVDYVLQAKVMPGWVRNLVEALPGPHTPFALIGW